ncbi:MAG: ASPIC/UnbV domain-containing protein [Acidobacteria bacterium]|nr:ASPIC/UnbV domain-containing protein [Acidobacteriota bacterium]
MPFTSGAVAQVDKYKQGFFFSHEFVGENSWNGYEHNCFFANVGGEKFMDVARPTGSDCVKDSRGVGVADFDGDGRLDMVINNNNETPTLYLNNLRKSGNAVELKLVGTRSNRDAVGARVRLTASGKTMMRQVEAGSGYASEAMLPVHFGLGNAERIDAVEITWPSGIQQRFEGESLGAAFGVNRLIRIEEGTDTSRGVTVARSLRHSAAPASGDIASTSQTGGGSMH